MNKISQLFVFLISLGYILTTQSCHQPEYLQVQGFAQGTTFSIIYKTEKAQYFEKEINILLKKFDKSLSAYDSASIISKINRNEPVELDSLFMECIRTGQIVAEETNGAFDLTVAPLVYSYRKHKKNGTTTSMQEIDSLRQFVGYHKIELKNNRLIKQDERIKIDVDAIAQGYSVDVISKFLESKGITDYMVEIGGEIRTKGINSKGSDWRIGIDKPIDNSTPENRELQTIIAFSNKSLATSGNYRNFYVKDGKKFAHTINPKTGLPAENDLLSVTVITETCIYADAYATAFMTMGLKESERFIQTHPGIEAYFIYTDQNDSIQITYTNGFKKYLQE